MTKPLSNEPSNELRERQLLTAMPALSRRRLLQMIAGASALTVTSGLLAACGDDDDDDDTDGDGGAAGPYRYRSRGRWRRGADRV
jgi:hypothetical protein